jgi:ketopantoate reductase
MKIAVMSAGAVGCCYGFKLARATIIKLIQGKQSINRSRLEAIPKPDVES